MKRITPFLLSILLFGCSKHSQADHPTFADTPSHQIARSQTDTALPPSAQSQNGKDELEYVNADHEHPFYFKPVLNFPKIGDTVKFLTELRQSLLLDSIGSYGDTTTNAVNYYKKVHVFGSKKDYILLEYDFHDGPMVMYPWKNQFLFDMHGKLIAKFWAKYLRFIDILPNQPPMLLGLFETGHGNGWHRVFVMGTDSLEDVYNGFLPINDYNYVETYDASNDNHQNRPYELKLSIKDINGDGINDLTFIGKRMHVDDKEREVWKNVQYIFLYNARTGHFEPNKEALAAFKF